MHVQIIVFDYLLLKLWNYFLITINCRYSKIIEQTTIENKFRMPSVEFLRAKSFLEMSLGVTFSYVYVK